MQSGKVPRTGKKSVTGDSFPSPLVTQSLTGYSGNEAEIHWLLIQKIGHKAHPQIL